ncbi:MAG: T9SS type A sorting domain-containing protein [Bacteroidetes bacterium]|nr:MAG: T9SS type A sorting domain-containing protein [Bacteroidota bacterium]
MKKIIFGILLLSSFSGTAQAPYRHVVATGGAFGQSPGISLSYTVGEVAVTTLTGASSILTQGFQQPDGLFVGIVDPVSGFVTSHAYPNPVSSQLTLELASSKNEHLIITCHDLLGRTVLAPVYQSLNAGETIRLQMDVQQLIPAMYFIRIMRKNDQQALETIRIIKSH